MESMTRGVQTNVLKEGVKTLIPGGIGRDIEKPCQSMYLLHDAFIGKARTPKKPEFEWGTLTELQGEGSSAGKATEAETGAEVG